MRPLIPVLVLIIALFSAQLAAAQEYDFTASAPRQIDACACDSITRSMTVTNTGDFPGIFTLQQSGRGAAFLSYVPAIFVLTPNEAMTIIETINAPCRVEDTFPVKTIITTDAGVKKSFEQTIDVSQCKNVALKVNAILNSGCRCSTFTYQVDITNTDGFTDTYSLVSDRPDITVIAPTSLRLQEGETGKAYVTITPDCTVVGDHDVTLTGISHNNNDQTIALLPYSIDDICYAYAQPPAESFDLKPILPWLFLLGPLVFVLALVIIAVITRRPSRPTPQPSQKKVDKYPWKKMFEEKKEKPTQKVDLAKTTDHTILFIIFGVIALLLLAFLTFLPFAGILGGVNETNQTMNVTPTPMIEPLMNETETNITDANITDANLTGLPFLSGASAGISVVIILVVFGLVIAGVGVILQSRKERKPLYASPKEEKPKKEEKSVKKESVKKVGKVHRVRRHLLLPRLPTQLPRVIRILVSLVVALVVALLILIRTQITEYFLQNPVVAFISLLVAITAVILLVLLKLWFEPEHDENAVTPPLKHWHAAIVAASSLAVVAVLYWFRIQIASFLTGQGFTFYILLGLITLTVILLVLRLIKSG